VIWRPSIDEFKPNSSNGSSIKTTPIPGTPPIPAPYSGDTIFRGHNARFAGRAAPVAGWAMTAYDLYQIGKCSLRD
jgi:hypothetical protein